MEMWRLQLIIYLVFSLDLATVYSWDEANLEIYDAVEDVGQNFYDLLGVGQSARLSEIKRAYRKLTLKHHPDKSNAPDAAEQFRKLVSVYEILKDEDKRKRYDDVLVNGLPDWRQPVYYYRRVRKLGLLELALLLSVVCTIGHFLIMWASYFEKRLSWEEYLRNEQKKFEKKMKKAKRVIDEDDLEDELQEKLKRAVPKPSIKNAKSVWYFTISIPAIIGAIQQQKRLKAQYIEEQRRQLEQEALEEERRQQEHATRTKKKPRVQEYTEFADVEAVSYTEVIKHSDENDTQKERRNVGATWTDADRAFLAKAVTRFPAGTPNRWERIAEYMGRTEAEVTKKAKEMKGKLNVKVDPKAQGLTGELDDTAGARHLDKVDITTRDNAAAVTMKVKPQETDENCDNGEDRLAWTQTQQRALEVALATFPKGTDERWERIAESIPGKSKEDCMVRFRYLAEIVKKRKERTK